MTLYGKKPAAGTTTTSFHDLGNWWKDPACTIPADALPDDSDAVVLLGETSLVLNLDLLDWDTRFWPLQVDATACPLTVYSASGSRWPQGPVAPVVGRVIATGNAVMQDEGAVNITLLSLRDQATFGGTGPNQVDAYDNAYLDAFGGVSLVRLFGSARLGGGGFMPVSRVEVHDNASADVAGIGNYDGMTIVLLDSGTCSNVETSGSCGQLNLLDWRQAKFWKRTGGDNRWQTAAGNWWSDYACTIPGSAPSQGGLAVLLGAQGPVLDLDAAPATPGAIDYRELGAGAGGGAGIGRFTLRSSSARHAPDLLPDNLAAPVDLEGNVGFGNFADHRGPRPAISLGAAGLF